MKKLLCGIALFLGMYSLQAQVALHGLYTPIHLNPDTTYIYLRDYLVDEKADSVQWPPELQNISSKRDTLILLGKMFTKTALLHLHLADERRSILLINSDLRPVTLKIASARVGKPQTLRLIGDFNNWNRNSPALKPEGGYYTFTTELAPGKYAYKLLVDGEETLDPGNPKQIPNGFGSFNNVLKIQPEDSTAVGDFRVLRQSDNSVMIRFNSRNTALTTFIGNRLEPGARWDEGDTTIVLLRTRRNDSLPKRSYIRIYAWNNSRMGKSQLIPLEYGSPLSSVAQLDRSDWHQARMYFLMVDRFRNGQPANDLPTPDPGIHPKANYYGGDLAGVTEALKLHYFDSLYYNTVWLSPITQNPEDAWGNWDKGETKSKFSAYHGYWPVSNRLIDHRFGNSAELQNLLSTAHSQGKNVILDYVANHVHLHHPIYRHHPSWATSLYLEDGSKNTEKWDEHRLTTWFDDHLPTLDLRRWEVTDPMVDSALFWLSNYDFDGFRHDATKHIDELFWRTLTYRIRRQNQRPVLQIGETYGSPDLINSYISTGMLDAQFDFNLYDAAVSAFAGGSDNLQNLHDRLLESLRTYGYHHLMGNISGNQDRARFISLAGGDVKFEEDHKMAGWDREIGKPSAEAYQKLALLHAFNNAIPGIPCTYYGDEYGLPGAGDPDNRRMMEFDGLDQDEARLKQQVAELNKLRAAQLALIYGSTEIDLQDQKLLIIKRQYFDEEVTILINASPENQRYRLPAGVDPQRAFNSEKSGSYVLLPPLSFEYLIH